jgi:hypothetical protein
MGGANLAREDGAVILGEVETRPNGPFSYDFPTRGVMPGFRMTLSPVVDLVWFLFRTFLAAALAVLLVMFLPRHAERVAEVAVTQPVITGGVGLLTAVVSALLLPLLAITLILIPVSVLGALLLVAMGFFGVAALGLEVGRRLERQFRQEWPPAVAAGLGAFILVLVVFGLAELVPCIGWTFPVLLGAVAIGAVLLTRFGTVSYPPAVSGLAPAGTPGVPPASWGAPAGAARTYPAPEPPPAQDDYSL